MNILLTNDDGIHAAGLEALVKSMPKDIRFVVAAPANERSAASHSITLGQKLRVEEYRQNGTPLFAVHGTPADCVKFALGGIKGFVPDLILSGINQGANTGVSVYYSGTISAAREGFINGVPSIAVSLASKTCCDFKASVELIHSLIARHKTCGFPSDVMLNINIPPLASENIKGIKITKQAHSRFIEEFVPQEAHEDKKVFMLTGTIQIYDADGTSDEEALSDGWISVTPLKLDLTDHAAIPLLRDWIGLNNGPQESRRVRDV